MALLPVLNCQSSAKVLMLLLLVVVQIVWTEPVAKRSTSKSSSGGCGGTLTGVGGVIEFPYGLTSTQSSQVHCTWIIMAPESHYILFHAESFSIPKERFSENCNDASLRFYDKKQRYLNIVPSACGEELTPKLLATNLVSIEYVEKTTDFQLKRKTHFSIVWTAYHAEATCKASESTQTETVALSRKRKRRQKRSTARVSLQPDPPVNNNNKKYRKRVVADESEQDIENGLFRCERSKLCVSRELLCNGHVNCGLDKFGNLDDSDEKCVATGSGFGWSGGFWGKNWNVVLSIGAVLTVTMLAIVSYYLRHQAILRARRKRRVEAMHKRERHFDDPLPPVPPPLSLSEMGTQSSLNLTTAKNPPNDYSMLPPTPYDMMNAANGQKYPTHFGMPDVTAVQIQAARNPGTGTMPHPQSTRGGTGGGGGGGGGMHWASGNFRRSQSAASSKASSSPTSSRSAPASRHPPAPNGCQQQHSAQMNPRNSHRTLMSDSNDSDSAVFSGSERGGVVSSVNGCRRKHHRDCPHKKSRSNFRHSNHPNREWEIQYDPNNPNAMTNVQAPCMCQGSTSQFQGHPNVGGQFHCHSMMQNPNYVELVNPFVEQQSSNGRRSRSQDFLDINEAHGIPHQVRLQSASNLRNEQQRGRNGKFSHNNFAYRSSQGYHSENDSYRAPLAKTRGRPVMGGSRGYKSETDDGGSSVVSAGGRGSSSNHGNNHRATTAQRAFALLRKQQQEQMRMQQKQQLQTHQYEQIQI